MEFRFNYPEIAVVGFVNDFRFFNLIYFFLFCDLTDHTYIATFHIIGAN